MASLRAYARLTRPKADLLAEVPMLGKRKDRQDEKDGKKKKKGKKDKSKKKGKNKKGDKKSKKKNKKKTSSSSSSSGKSSSSSDSGSDADKKDSGGASSLYVARAHGVVQKLTPEELEAERQWEEQEEAKRKASYLLTPEQIAKQQREAALAAERAERTRREEAAAAERALREEEEARKKEREAKAAEEEWERQLNEDPSSLRKAGARLMRAEYGSSVDLEGTETLPLRVITKQKQVAWIWFGAAQELIGGGTNLPEDTLS